MLVLLYDGLCGFCDRTVQFILARDPGGSMMFAPLQGEFAAGILQRHPELRKIDSLILVENRDGAGDARVSVRSEAMLGIANYLGGPWRAAMIMKVIPSVLRDWGYDLFARHRYRIFGRFDSCPAPDAGVRARFLP
jgi:predicted DCC family thiol-disulfide oxidoreductase YuxK